MAVDKCSCENREIDGLCKYKFVKEDKEVLCCNPKKRKVIKCVEESHQLFLFRKRYNR
jgi:hypothetical protein